MRLVASMIVKNEMSRLLPLTVAAFESYVDEIRVLDDGSTDGTYEFLDERGISVLRNDGPGFYEHEGKARQKLYEFTLQARPTHVLAIDADEVAIIDRDALNEGDAWLLQMNEVWKVDETRMFIRSDGGWRPHGVPILYRPRPRFRIQERALACGREPMEIRKLARRAQLVGQIFHYGWTDESKRAARYQRYVEHDNGEFHQRRHLDSIMWTDKRVQTVQMPWPESLLPIRDHFLK